MKGVVAAAVAVGAFGVAAPAFSGPWFVVYADTRVGHFRVKADGTLGGAVREWGQPTTRVRSRRDGTCTLRWRPYGLTMTFYNLGGQDPCAARTGFFGSAVITGGRWMTASLLPIGAPVSTLRQRHPRAGRRAGTQWWWLVRRLTPIGEGGLEAKVHRGRVTAFRVTYQAGGE